jgi:hypothetical protein
MFRKNGILPIVNPAAILRFNLEKNVLGGFFEIIKF